MNNKLKQVYVILDDEDIIELIRILIDQDKPAALTFLKNHLGELLRSNGERLDETCFAIEPDRN